MQFLTTLGAPSALVLGSPSGPDHGGSDDGWREVDLLTLLGDGGGFGGEGDGEGEVPEDGPMSVIVVEVGSDELSG
jgi:hypothetical protein